MVVNFILKDWDWESFWESHYYRQTELDLCPRLLGWLRLCLSCSYSAGRLQRFPRFLLAEMASDLGPVRELCFVKNNAIQRAARARPLWKQAAASQGIVTRCKGGNTWSIPRWRNVFISLFTNVAISRCVHFKVHCSTGSPSSGAWLQWGTCAEARASLFEQLAQFSPACTCARRSEGVVPHRVRKNTGLQRDRLYLIQCHRIRRPLRRKGPQSGRARDETLTAGSVKATSRCADGDQVWCSVRIRKVFENLQQVVSVGLTVGDVKSGVSRWK